jgi:hypothetical protein
VSEMSRENISNLKKKCAGVREKGRNVRECGRRTNRHLDQCARASLLELSHARILQHRDVFRSAQEVSAGSELIA